MTSDKVSVRDLMPVTVFFALLPGVKPRVAKQLVESAFNEAIVCGVDHFQIGTVQFLVDAANTWWVRTVEDTACLTPAGANAMVTLYLAGQLPMSTKTAGGVPDSVTAYCDSQAELEQRYATRQAAKEAERLAFESLVANPESVTEADFTYALLDAIFWRHHGPGSGRLGIGAVVVQKSVLMFASNSGKSRDSDVEFTWVSAEHGLRSLKKSSSYAGNRRNDESRNFGLPE